MTATEARPKVCLHCSQAVALRIVGQDEHSGEYLHRWVNAAGPIRVGCSNRGRNAYCTPARA